MNAAGVSAAQTAVENTFGDLTALAKGFAAVPCGSSRLIAGQPGPVMKLNDIGRRSTIINRALLAVEEYT